MVSIKGFMISIKSAATYLTLLSMNFPNIFRLAAFYTRAPALKIKSFHGSTNEH